MSANRIVVAAIALLALVAAADAVRSDKGREPEDVGRGGYRIDLATSRDGTGLPVSTLRRAFPGDEPPSLAISKVAVAPDGIVAVAVSHVSGRAPARAAVELWDGERFVGAFPVAAGSFSRGLWFAGEGRAIATIGWNGRGYLYDREGRPLRGRAYFAYTTG